MRRSLIAILFAVGLLGRGSAQAQVIEVPVFELGPSIVGHMQDVDVSVGTDGSIVFVWGEYNAADGDSHAVTHWFSPQGEALTEPVIVDTLGEVYNPRIHSDPRGGHIAVWLWTGNGYRVRARRLNAGGRGGASDEDFQVDRNGLGPASFSIAPLGIPSGSAFLWSQNGVRTRVYYANGAPRDIDFKLGGHSYRMDAEALPDGGFIAAWGGSLPDRFSQGRIFNPDGSPRTERFTIGASMQVHGVAVSPAGAIAVVAIVQEPDSRRVVVQRLDPNGTPLGALIPVAEYPDPSTHTPYIDADLDFDHFGNLLVAWRSSDGETQGERVVPTCRAFAADGTPYGPAVPLAPSFRDGSEIRVTRLLAEEYGGSGFIAAWYKGGRAFASIASLQNALGGVCGDGVLDPASEQCDAGAGNSDTQADACRTACILARCGDGVLDSGEACDDGNGASCDGCSGDCQLEPGGICGDGVLDASCGEACDDGNTLPGDGCSATCTIERIRGRSKTASQCLAEWGVSNPTNLPQGDKHGEFTSRQECNDNDPLCDFDGGVTGGCRFRVRLCANNTNSLILLNSLGCAPTTIESWELRKPSQRRASRRPVDGAIRSALLAGATPVLDSTEPDSCSELVEIDVPLKGKPGRYHKSRYTLEVRAYSEGLRDKDKLKLTCVPEHEDPVSFGQVWNEVLLRDCVFCHNPNQECCDFLDFTTLSSAQTSLFGAGREDCAGVPRVVAGNPDASLLYQKLVNPDVCGVRMPAQMTFPETFHDCTGTRCLSPEALEWVRRWILEGASFD